jgi:hypothetical protein
MTLRRALVYGLGVALGVMLALPNGRHDATDAMRLGAGLPANAPGSDSSPTQPGVGDVSDPSSAMRDGALLRHARADESMSSQGNRVYAASGVTLESLRSDDVFVGYAVVRSHDARLDVGDVITAVNGQLVEDSAAGGELLIAALRNPDAALTLQSRSDWTAP